MQVMQVGIMHQFWQFVATVLCSSVWNLAWLKLDKGQIMKLCLDAANTHRKFLDEVDLLLSDSNNAEGQWKNIGESARGVAE